MTIATYQQPNGHALALPADQQPTSAVARLVDWAESAKAAHQVAVSLVQTSFVPEAFRGKAHEATAAILAGAEVGLSPMAALRSFDVIQGTAAPRAITLRAIVQSQGHSIRLVESTETRAIVEACRKGDHEWQRSTWTIQRAQKLGLVNKPNWKNQPAAMLVARATAEACRLVAADAILGIGYAVEELGDDAPADTSPTAEPKKRTMRRQAPPAAPLEEPPPVRGITDAQMRKMHALFRDHGISEREQRLRFVSETLGTEVTSSKDLTLDEAKQVIDELERLTPAQGEPPLADDEWPAVAEVPQS